MNFIAGDRHPQSSEYSFQYPSALFLCAWIEEPCVIFGIRDVTAHHFVYRFPAGEGACVAVVDVDVGVELAAALGGRVVLIDVMFVDRIEFQPSGAAIFYRIIQKGAFPDGPEDETVTVSLKPFQDRYGAGHFSAYGGIGVLDYRSVEIYRYCHCVYFIGAPRWQPQDGHAAAGAPDNCAL